MKAQSIVVAICFAFINYGNAQGIVSYGGYINSTSSSYITLDNGGSLTLDDFSSTAVVADLDGNTIISGDLINNTTSTTILNASTGVFEFDGTGTQYIVGPDNMELQSIKISNDVELSSDIIISTTLVLNSGNLILDVNDLKILTSGTITGSSSTSYIIPESSGVLKLYAVSGGTIVFPIGTSTSYSPASIILTSGNSQYFDGSVMDGVYEDGTTGANLALTDPVVDRTWILTADDTHLVNMTMQWNASDEVNGFDRTTALSNIYDTEWNTSSATITGSDPYVLTINDLDDINSKNTHAISGGLSPLPIELLSFYGSYESKAVELKWVTASEINNDYFVVERLSNVTADDYQWNSIGQISANGNSNEVLNYMFTDDKPNTSVEVSYYRLKQVDYNGRYSYSDIIPIYILDNREVMVYPNPSSNGIFYFKGIESKIEIYNSMGKMILGVDYSQSKIDISSMSNGIYYIKCNNKFIKINKQ